MKNLTILLVCLACLAMADKFNGFGRPDRDSYKKTFDLNKCLNSIKDIIARVTKFKDETNFQSLEDLQDPIKLWNVAMMLEDLRPNLSYCGIEPENMAEFGADYGCEHAEQGLSELLKHVSSSDDDLGGMNKMVTMMTFGALIKKNCKDPNK